MATNTQDNNQLCHSNITPISHSQTLQSKRHVPPNTRLHQSKYAGNTTLMFSISAHNTWQRQTRNRRKHKYHTVAILSISAQKLNPNNTVLHSKKQHLQTCFLYHHTKHTKYQIKHPPQPPTSTLANPIGKANISTNTTVHTVTVPIPYTQKPLVINDKTIITYQHTETHTTIFPTIIQVKSASLYPQANNLSEIQIFYYPTRINIANTNKTPIIRACNNYKREYKQLPSVITDLTPANHPHTVKQQTSNSTSQNTLSKSHNKHQTKVAFTQTDYTSQTTSNTQVCTTTNITTKTQHRIQLISKVSKQSKPLTKQTYPQQNYQAQHLHHIGNYTNHKHNKSPDPTPNQHHTISTTCPNPLYSGIKPNNTRVAVLHYFSLSSPKSLRNCTVCPFINLSIIEARSSHKYSPKYRRKPQTPIPSHQHYRAYNLNTVCNHSPTGQLHQSKPTSKHHVKQIYTNTRDVTVTTGKLPNSLIAVTQIFYNHITPYLKQIRKLYQVTKHANHQSITNTTTSKHSTTIPQQTSAANKPTTGNLQSMLRPKYTNACNYKPNYPVQVNKSSTQQQAPKLITIAGSECVQSLEHKPCATKTTHIKKLQISVTRPKRITNPAITYTRITPTSLLIKSNKYNHNIQPYTNNWASGHHLRSIIQQHSNHNHYPNNKLANAIWHTPTNHNTSYKSRINHKQDTPQAKYHVTTQLSHGFNIVNKVVPKMYSRQAPVLYHKHPMHGSKLQTNAKFTLTTLLVQLPLKGINAPKLTKYNPNPHNTVNHLGTLTYQYQSLIVNTIIANQTTIIYHNPKHITFSQSTAPSLVKPQVKPIRTTRRKHDPTCPHQNTHASTTIPVLPTSKRNQYNPSVYHHHPAALTTILNQQVHHSLPKPNQTPQSQSTNSKTPTFKVKYKNNQTTNLQQTPTIRKTTTTTYSATRYNPLHSNGSIPKTPPQPVSPSSNLHKYSKSAFCNNNTHTQHRALKTRTPSGSSMHKPKPVHTKETRQPYPQTTYHQNTTHKTHSYSTLNLQHQKPLMNLQPKSTQTHPKTPKFPQQQYLLQPGLHHANLQELISHVKPNIQVHQRLAIMSNTKSSAKYTEASKYDTTEGHNNANTPQNTLPQQKHLHVLCLYYINLLQNFLTRQPFTQEILVGAQTASQHLNYAEHLCCHNGVPAQTITPNGAYQHTLSTTNHSHQPKTSIRAHATKAGNTEIHICQDAQPKANTIPHIHEIRNRAARSHAYKLQAIPTQLIVKLEHCKTQTQLFSYNPAKPTNCQLQMTMQKHPAQVTLASTTSKARTKICITSENHLRLSHHRRLSSQIPQTLKQQFKHNQPSPGTTFTHHNAYWESKPQPSKSHNKNNCQFTHQQQANLNTECVKQCTRKPTTSKANH
eukprot:gene13211-9057_t